MLTLKQIKNLKNEKFYKEFVKINKRVSDLKTSRKYIIFNFFLYTLSFLFSSYYFLFQTEINKIIGILLASSVLFLIVLAENKINKIRNKNIDFNFFRNIKILDSGSVYNKKEINDLTNDIKNMSKESSYLLTLDSKIKSLNLKILTKNLLLNKIDNISSLEELIKNKEEIIHIAQNNLTEKQGLKVLSSIEKTLLNNEKQNFNKKVNDINKLSVNKKTEKRVSATIKSI